MLGKAGNLGEVKSLNDNLYYRIIFIDASNIIIILTNNNYIKYVSTADSRYKCKFEIKQVSNGKIVVDCEFNVDTIKI